MRYLTIEQRESLERALKQRVGALREEIGTALHQSDETRHLANRFLETREEPIADLEETIEIASVQRDLQELKGVTDALKRIHEPEYGVCADCEAEIPFTRLQAEPSAMRCVACQTQRERMGSTHASL